MGARGPVGKRSSERMGHRSKAEKKSVTKAVGAKDVEAPETKDDWHPIARRWFDSLKESGQSHFYEPSDWAAAELVAEAMTRNLGAGQRFSAQLFAAVWSAMNDLLTTEGDRRRVKLELERVRGDEKPPASVTVLDDYRAALAG